MTRLGSPGNRPVADALIPVPAGTVPVTAGPENLFCKQTRVPCVSSASDNSSPLHVVFFSVRDRFKACEMQERDLHSTHIRSTFWQCQRRKTGEKKGEPINNKVVSGCLKCRCSNSASLLERCNFWTYPSPRLCAAQ